MTFTREAAFENALINEFDLVPTLPRGNAYGATNG